jgi:hypothetical protein
MAKDVALTSIRIDSALRKQVKIKSAQDDVPIARALREFVTAWVNGDPNAKAIVEKAKTKK